MTAPNNCYADEISVEKIIGLPPSGKQAVKVKKYDFKRPDKFTLDQIRTLQIMHETASRLMATWLSAAIRKQVDVSVHVVDQMTFGEFIASIPNPTCMMILGMEPLNGNAVLEIDPDITFGIIDRILGGNGEAPSIKRDLTNIEVIMMQGLYGKGIRKSLSDAWSTIIPLSPVLRSIETNSMFVQIVPPTEMVILVSFNVKAGSKKGMINFCIPFLTIEPLLHKLTARYWYSSVRKRSVPMVGTIAPDLPVDAELYYPTTPLSLAEIDAVSKGAPVRLDSCAAGSALLDVGGIPVLGLRREADGFVVLPGHDDTEELLGMDKKHELSPAEIVSEQLGKFKEEITSIVSAIDRHVREWQRQQGEFSDQLLSGFRQPDVEQVKQTGIHRPFSFIRQENGDDLFLLLQPEYPQLTALILSFLDPGISSRLLEKFTLELQTDIINRISNLDRTAPEVLKEVEHYFEGKMKEMSVLQELYVAGGIKTVVEILSRSTRSTEKNIIETMEKQNPELAEEVKKLLFVFEDVVLLDRKALASVIANCNLRDVAISLKVAPEDVKAYILSCMNESDQANLKKLIEESGRVRLKDAEEAQQRIVNTIREMEESGLVIVARIDDIVE